eukprot:gnl/TRDRNA2_/TRDRNA2_83662_c0_seq1.p1 gnl/TRDRNA2_/TRDRNA2_83662_c0~~gnl/TRDRNA2_/TRDRNA2_83662_c0_seq1.p1  ORF type:complete len:202 (+),score=14.19 gnl/TRDRNA2_/TRDRNA2_83662_c0_seq1:517-1122(+)
MQERMAESDVGSPDILFLNITENMNNGKTLAFFKYVSSTFNWATHIGKMDMDTYPFLQKLITSFNDNAGDPCESYVGVCYGGYMQGGLYVLSRRLAQGITRDKRWHAGLWDPKQKYEDALTGRAVREYVHSAKACLKTWDPRAWFHCKRWWNVSWARETGALRAREIGTNATVPIHWYNHARAKSAMREIGSEIGQREECP